MKQTIILSTKVLTHKLSTTDGYNNFYNIYKNRAQDNKQIFFIFIFIVDNCIFILLLKKLNVSQKNFLLINKNEKLSEILNICSNGVLKHKLWSE